MLFSISVLGGIAELAPSKCCWRNIGAVFRTAPILIANVAQFLVICATSRRAKEARELPKARCACVPDIGTSGQDEPESSLANHQVDWLELRLLPPPLLANPYALVVPETLEGMCVVTLRA